MVSSNIKVNVYEFHCHRRLQTHQTYRSRNDYDCMFLLAGSDKPIVSELSMQPASTKYSKK